QMTTELEYLESTIDYCVVPPLCPLVGSPYDFTRTDDHIARAVKSTEAWIADGGLGKAGIPGEMRPHQH
ncbi:MAG: patatin-like phospholipase family protein, partial [Afipia sp.]